MVDTLMAAVAASQPPIPFDNSNAVSYWFLMKILVITALLLGAVYLVLLLLKRKNWLPAQHGKPGSQLEVIDSCKLGLRTTLYMVRFRSKYIAVIESPQKTSVLPIDEQPDDEEIQKETE